MSNASIADLSRPLAVGSVTVSNRVFLAPMSGVTDTPFRAVAQDLGAGGVVSEMVASSEWVRGKRKAVAKAAGLQPQSQTPRGRTVRPFILQLAGREAYWMAEAARLAEQSGVDIVDINMGCPAREVTGMLSGSALMRDLDHAAGLIAAVVGAVRVPVTLKMRLGWDDDTRNAPELARRAEALGVKLITVHGRTRCQFYRGAADWAAVAEVKRAVRVPLVVNGDIVSASDARRALAASGADAVMVGRGAYGAPWLPGLIAKSFAAGRDLPAPSQPEQVDIMAALAVAMVDHHGEALGIRMSRKHFGWLLERLALTPDERRAYRKRLCTADRLACVREDLHRLANALAHAERAAA